MHSRRATVFSESCVVTKITLAVLETLALRHLLKRQILLSLLILLLIAVLQFQRCEFLCDHPNVCEQLDFLRVRLDVPQSGDSKVGIFKAAQVKGYLSQSNAL